MAETSHARSRRAALAGLVLQIITTVAAFALTNGSSSTAMALLTLYLAGGIPIWFILLLVFRQHELAALEALDLEALRREKQASGGGEAMFDPQGGGGLGFMVAQARLEWMLRWLVPLFGLLTAAYLVLAGIGGWLALGRGDEAGLGELRNVEISMVLSALLMLFLFFFARYTAGMARVSGWQLLRGGSSYMLGNTVAALAVIVALGANLYQGTVTWERVVAYAIAAVMVVLGAEILIGFLVDLYRPRAPGVEPRACFDSRLLGLISEPGGIAHSMAEAINYQFGFKVSQTWFYQLLQRAFLWLVGVGVVAVWLLSCIVVVQPYERAIIERWGRQTDADHPLEPGLHFKWPAPIEIARRYNTDQLHEFYIGYRDFYEPKHTKETKNAEGSTVELWTDRQHGGRDHFDFIIAPTPRTAAEQKEEQALEPAAQAGEEERAAQHLVRAVTVVQYKIDPGRLADFTQQLKDPDAALKRIAWNEMTRFVASTHIDQLLGELRDEGGRVLRERIGRRADELKLGLDIKYVGILQVHPTQDVAKAFRSVVTAQQEKIAEIRKARVTENEKLSRVAGDKRRALALAHAIEQVHQDEVQRNELERELREAAKPGPASEDLPDDLRAAAVARLRAQWGLELKQQEYDRIKDDFDLGLGGSLNDQERAKQAVTAAQAELAQAEQAWQTAVAPFRAELVNKYGKETSALWLDHAVVKTALAFWHDRLEKDLGGLEGEAAVNLAKAQARRWQQEMQAAGEVALLQNERYAFAAAPEIYKARSYLQALVKGIKDSRKYFLAFDPAGREVHVRLEAQEQAQPDIVNMPTNIEQKK